MKFTIDILIYENDLLRNYFFTNDYNDYDKLLFDDIFVLTFDDAIILKYNNLEDSLFCIAHYLVSMKETVIVSISGVDSDSQIVSDILNDYITEMNNDIKERNIERIFNQIESFSKKFCIDKSFDKKYGKEWLDIIITAEDIKNLKIEGISTISEKLLSYFKIHFTTKNCISDEVDNFYNNENELVPVFYFNLSDSYKSLFPSFDTNKYIRNTKLFIPNYLYENIKEFNPVLYTVILYRKEEIIEELNSHFIKIIDFANYDSDLILDSDLIYRIFKKKKTI